MVFKEQAENCRRQANEFSGRPEAPFLLRVASVFDELAIDRGVATAAGAEHRTMTVSRPAISA
jgi:hypothetical protein